MSNYLRKNSSMMLTIFYIYHIPNAYDILHIRLHHINKFDKSSIFHAELPQMHMIFYTYNCTILINTLTIPQFFLARRKSADISSYKQQSQNRTPETVNKEQTFDSNYLADANARTQ